MIPHPFDKRVLTAIVLGYETIAELEKALFSTAKEIRMAVRNLSEAGYVSAQGYGKVRHMNGHGARIRLYGPTEQGFRLARELIQ